MLKLFLHKKYIEFLFFIDCVFYLILNLTFNKIFSGRMLYAE